MDMVLLDVVGAEVAYGLNGIRLATDLDFVALHRLLDCSADFTDAHIHTSSLNSISFRSICEENVHARTLIPVFVASFTAANRSS